MPLKTSPETGELLYTVQSNHEPIESKNMKQYRMTEEELKMMMNASKPVTYMVFNGQPPSSPQENANNAWQQIADRVGCDKMSIKPAATGDNRDFMANPLSVEV